MCVTVHRQCVLWTQNKATKSSLVSVLLPGAASYAPIYCHWGMQNEITCLGEQSKTPGDAQQLACHMLAERTFDHLHRGPASRLALIVHLDYHTQRYNSILLDLGSLLRDLCCQYLAPSGASQKLRSSQLPSLVGHTQ
jgi:hypothetical protein